MQERQTKKIYIIGAGISGLVAAKRLEQEGFSPTIIEATEDCGGRVKTIDEAGCKLDVGFQVLLDAYPMAKKHLDYSDLKLQKFLPGAVIFVDGKQIKIGDPGRSPRFLLDSLFAKVGTFGDKLKILKLSRQLRKKTIAEIFTSDEVSTAYYLESFGFSTGMINQFFKPFFTGIFLEDKLETSSRMFEFVFKMFAEGYAVLPKAGIQAIPNQLKGQLNHTRFIFNTKVETIQEQKLITTTGKELLTDGIIVATEIDQLVDNLRNQETTWKSCDNLYFECAEKVFDGMLIGLVSAPGTYVNNVFYLPEKTNGNFVLSVTVVKQHKLHEGDLINAVSEELKKHCNITVKGLLKHFHIKKALPALSNLQYDLQPSETLLKDTVFLAGDQQLNGSLNAAMLSGERAAEGLIEKLKGILA